jgi:hypothetical protein
LIVNLLLHHVQYVEKFNRRRGPFKSFEHGGTVRHSVDYAD